MAPETGPSRAGEKRGSPTTVITPRLAADSSKRRRRGKQATAAAPAAAAPPPTALPEWRHGWEEVADNEYTQAALRVIAKRQRRRQRAPAAAAAAAASSGGDAPKERRLRVDTAALEGFSDAERRGLPHCMSKFREKSADARRAYCDALLAVREITDSSHPAKQSGMDQGRPHEWGVFARRALVRGTLLGELTGLVCTGEEADTAAAADPRGLGGLRADKIKSLSMTAPRDDQGGAAGGGGSEGGGAAGWLQELVIDGGAKSCVLRFVNSHQGIRSEPNTACIEAEDIAAGTVHVFMVTIAPVEKGEELLLDYGPHFLRHIREEAQRAAALCTLERQVTALQATNAELLQQATRQKAHERLQDQAYLDLLEEYRAQQSQQRQQQQETQAAADQRVAAAEAQAAERVAAAEAQAAERVAAAEAEAAELQRRLAAAEAALAAARAEAKAVAERESASLAQFCSMATQREAVLGAHMQAALCQAAAQLQAKDAEIAAQRAAAEEACAELALGQQQWEVEREQLAELLHLAQQHHVEVHRMLASRSLSPEAAAALDAATAAFDAAAAALVGEEAGADAAVQQQAAEAEEEGCAAERTAAGAALPAALAAAAEVPGPPMAHGNCPADLAAFGAAASPATEQQQQQQRSQPAETPGSSPGGVATPPCEGAVLTAAAVAAALAAQEGAEQVHAVVQQLCSAAEAACTT